MAQPHLRAGQEHRHSQLKAQARVRQTVRPLAAHLGEVTVYRISVSFSVAQETVLGEGQGRHCPHVKHLTRSPSP